MIIPAASTLTIRLTANPLLGTVSRRQKRSLAVWTMAGLSHVDSPGCEGEISEENQNHGEDARRNENSLYATAVRPQVMANLVGASFMPSKVWLLLESAKGRPDLLALGDCGFGHSQNLMDLYAAQLRCDDTFFVLRESFYLSQTVSAHTLPAVDTGTGKCRTPRGSGQSSNSGCYGTLGEM